MLAVEMVVFNTIMAGLHAVFPLNLYLPCFKDLGNVHQKFVRVVMMMLLFLRLYINFCVFWHLNADFTLEYDEKNLAIIIFIKHHLSFSHLLNLHLLYVLLNNMGLFVAYHHSCDFTLLLFKELSSSFDISC